MGQRFLVLSPHLDDAALSCGGTIARLVAQDAEITVATIFAGVSLPEARSSFATAYHADRKLAEQRRAEDRAAFEPLGVSYLHGSFLDAVYRSADHYGTIRWLYPSRRSLFGRIDPSDSILPDVQAWLDDLVVDAECTILAPLAVGNHVDHQLVNRIGRLAAQSGRRVFFYEDFPYMRSQAALAAALAQLGDEQQPVIVPLDASAMEQKLTMITCYGSQLPLLFGTYAAMQERVVAAVAEVGGERFWSTATQGQLSPITLSRSIDP